MRVLICLVIHRCIVTVVSFGLLGVLSPTLLINILQQHSSKYMKALSSHTIPKSSPYQSYAVPPLFIIHPKRRNPRTSAGGPPGSSCSPLGASIIDLNNRLCGISLFSEASLLPLRHF